MAFPLIIDGYMGVYCNNCPMLNSDSKCSLFGELDFSASTDDCRRHEECIQMEQKHNKKPVAKDSGSPYDLSNDLNNIVKLAKTRQKLRGRKN